MSCCALRGKILVSSPLLLLLALCPLAKAASPSEATSQAEQKSAQITTLLPVKVGLLPVPLPQLDSLETPVRQQIASLQQSLGAMSSGSSLPDSELAEAYGTLGQLYHAYQFMDAAEACYLNSNRLEPKEFRSIYLLGTLYQQSARLPESVLYYKASLEIQPEYVAAAVNLGNVYAQMNRLDEARREFEKALALDPDSAAAHYGLGQVALGEGKNVEAIEHLQAAMAKVPEADRLHYSMAMAYRGMGELDKAKTHLAKRGLVGIRPPDPLLDSLHSVRRGERIHLIQGRLAFQAGRFEEAVESFARAVLAKPDSSRARVNLGSALGKTGNVEGAIEQYQQALRISPDNVTAQFNLGSLLAHKESHPEAIVRFRTVLKTNPDDVGANRELARSLMKLGQGEEASEYFSKAVSSDPNDEETLLQWVSVLIGLGRFGEARDRLDWANGLFPRRGRTVHAFARLLAACPDVSIRDGEWALKLAKKIYAARTTVAHGETVALALAELGRCEEAAQWQGRMVAAAEKAEKTDLAEQLKANLARYQRGAPCRPPALTERP